MNGVVVKFDTKKGFGFIRSDDFEQDIFVHVTSVRDKRPLVPGQQVEFDAKKTEKGLSAIDVIPGRKRQSPYMIYGVLSGVLLIGLLILGAMYMHPVVAYLVAVNITTFLIYGYDKFIAGRDVLRVPERVLHTLALIGGSPAGLLAQRVFRHKTIKSSFQLVYWAVVVVQVLVVVGVLWLRGG
ncbi:MAG: cold shock and DUF1294 domain-containing protein [Chloroflexota bacterium]